MIPLFKYIYYSLLLLLSCVRLCDPMDSSMPGFPVLHCLPKFAQIQTLSPLSQWCHPTIFLCHLPLLPSVFPSIRVFSSEFLHSLHQVAKVFGASASVLPMNIQDWFPLGLTGLISLLSKDSQESSPTPKFESINFSVLSFLYGPTLTSIHDYWKNHNFA